MFPNVETKRQGEFMKSYITCPVCGTKFGKAEEVKELDFQCPRCKENLIVNVSPTSVVIQKAEVLKKDIQLSTNSKDVG
jgi:transcription initiation factor IIE alpha subunit